MPIKKFIGFNRLFARLIFAGIALFCSAPAFAQTVTSLERVSFSNIPSSRIFDRDIFLHKEEMLRGIASTLAFLQSDSGRTAYLQFKRQGISSSLVEQSLRCFYDILRLSRSHADLEQQVRKTFDLYRTVGNDGAGSVRFTGYFQPVYKASLVRNREYRFPIFRLPPTFNQWSLPHPTRVALEGYDGLAAPGTYLHGYEIAWLKSRFDVFMVQVQGSAVLEFADGTHKAIGYAAGTDYPFKGISGTFLREHNVAWNKLDKFFAQYPEELNKVLSKNNRFIFFREQTSTQAIGSLGVPVIAERSIAVDKLRLPPGALSIIHTPMPTESASKGMQVVPTTRFVLNLDTGSAIKGPGRADIFMGTGEQAHRKANSIYGNGELYYLLKKDRSGTEPPTRETL